MFNKLKQYKDLRDQAKTLQNALAQEKVTVNKKGIKITINGNLEIESIKIEESVSRENIENHLPHILNDAIKDVQKVMATKMRSMGDLSSMLNF